jgi:MFS family permease
MACLCFRIGRRPVLFLGVVILVVGRCASAYTASLYSVFLVANFVANLPISVVFQSPLIIGGAAEIFSLNLRLEKSQWRRLFVDFTVTCSQQASFTKGIVIMNSSDRYSREVSPPVEISSIGV